MSQAHDKIARILNTKPEIIFELEQKLSGLSGQNGVVERLAAEIDQKIASRLGELGLTRETAQPPVYEALYRDLVALEKKLVVHIGGQDYQAIAQQALALENPGQGFFIKRDKAIQMLKANPPQVILGQCNYQTVEQLVDGEGLEAVYSALRFMESSDWMNNVFINSYRDVRPEDFEERDVKIIVLDQKWLKLSEKFLKKKYHNVSHLKELGVIFIIPIAIDTDGELLRVFTLLLHYLNEVPFYSGLFRQFVNEANFADKLMSLLRGDVPSGPAPENSYRIVQRYLAKDDKADFRLFEPHLNPEAEHWYKAQQSLAKLPGFEHLIQYDYVGDYFGEQLVSFDLIDTIMSLVKKADDKYLYHQQEALWNKIFIEHLGRERVDQLVKQNIIRGFITL